MGLVAGHCPQVSIKTNAMLNVKVIGS